MSPILLAILLVGGIAIVAGVGLGIANVIMAVKGNETAEKIVAVLPGANCGACSFSGCKGYAEALSTGKVKTNLCVVGGSKVAAQIAEILGTEAAETEAKCALVACRGDLECNKRVFDYSGFKSCKAAASFFGGDKACAFSCIGYGDCVNACEFGAVSVKNGVAKVNQSVCVGCGKCADACPKKIISIVPKKTAAAVLCSNPQKGPVKRKACTVGCMGCRMCEKACESGAITFDGFRAIVDAKKCVGCGKCVETCKFGCIIMR